MVSWMQKLLKYFKSLSIKKQFILIIMFTTVATLVISVIVLKTQIAKTRTSTDALLNDLNYKDYVQDTTLTSATLRNGFLGYMFAIAQILEQLQQTNTYFNQTPSVYNTSEVQSPLNLTTDCSSTPNYSAPALYLFDPTNTARMEQYSYFDVIMPYLMIEKPDNFKRLNIMFVNLLDPTKTVVRTFPATSNFSTPSAGLFLLLANMSTPGYASVLPPTPDPFTVSGQIISSLFTKIVVNSSFTIILSVDLIISNLEHFFSYVIYFPNAVIVYTITNPANNQTVILSISNSTLGKFINVSQLMASNMSTLKIDNTDYLVGITTFPGKFPITNLTSALESKDGPYSVLVLSRIKDMDNPSQTLVDFLDQYGQVSDIMFGVCSAITIMAVISFSYIAANLIAYPLSRLAHGIQHFLQGTQSTQVIVMLNEFKCDKQLRCLIKNSTAIFQKIEGEVRKNQGDNLHEQKCEFPENACDREFLRVMRSKALDMWEEAEARLEGDD